MPIINMGQFAREILRESVYVHNHIRTYTMNKTIMCICRPIARQGYGGVGGRTFSRGRKNFQRGPIVYKCTESMAKFKLSGGAKTFSGGLRPQLLGSPSLTTGPCICP